MDFKQIAVVSLILYYYYTLNLLFLIGKILTLIETKDYNSWNVELVVVFSIERNVL